MNYSIDPYTWYGERELTFLPRHFVLAQTPLTEVSKNWVLNNLSGRFAVVSEIVSEIIMIDDSFNLGKIAFENPQEATLYELRWS